MIRELKFNYYNIKSERQSNKLIQEVSVMGNNETYQQEFHFECFRCGCIINAGEKMVNLFISLETPTEDDSTKEIGGTSVSTLCFDCASVLLSQSIIGDLTLTIPAVEEREDNDVVEIDEDAMEKVNCIERELEDSAASLIIRHSSKGFCLVLDCGDGISRATSRLFTWRQIAQMLIAADPDMFGVLDEPLHQVFPRALKRLGYHVPDWRELQAENNLNGKENNNMSRKIRKATDNNGGQEEEELLIAEIHLQIAVKALEEEDWESAIQSFSSYLEFDPEDALAYDKRGIAYGNIYRFDEAIDDFSRAISIDDTFAGAYNNRGLSYYKKSQFDEAIVDYARSIALAPDIAVFYANRGLAHMWKGNLTAAFADYNKAIWLEPTLQETHNNRGEAYAQMGLYQQAIEDFDRELELNPNDANAYASRTLALQLFQENKHPER
jgi:tetratricopeptide (TPR) repeat protein